MDKLFLSFDSENLNSHELGTQMMFLFYNKCVSMIAFASSLPVAKIAAFLVDLARKRKFVFVDCILPHLTPLIGKNWTRDPVKTEMCHQKFKILYHKRV